MAETKDRILEVALDMFIDRGYDKVTLREIAEKVGVTKAALYYHFTSKEQILITLVEPLVKIQSQLMHMLSEAPTPESWARGLAAFVNWAVPQRRLFELSESNHAMLRSLMSRSEFADNHAELHEQLEAVLADESVPLEDRVRMAGATGLVIGVLAFPRGNPFGNVPPEEFGRLVVDAVSDVLRVKI